MSQVFGSQVPPRHVQREHREVTTYLVVIGAAEGPTAKLLLANRKQVAELDANTEEVTSMIKGRTAEIGATGPEWDRALSSHSAKERAESMVYSLNP